MVLVGGVEKDIADLLVSGAHGHGHLARGQLDVPAQVDLKGSLFTSRSPAWGWGFQTCGVELCVIRIGVNIPILESEEMVEVDQRRILTAFNFKV